MRLLSTVLLFMGLLVSIPAFSAVDNFTFIQITDTHFPSPGGQSEHILPGIAKLGEITLTPYNLVVPKPSFVISTGDVTEFGGGHGDAWKNFTASFNELTIPLYIQSGNHDSTWFPNRPEIRQRYGADNYSFDAHGCHFIGLDTAGLLDPRPSFGAEQLRWLQKDLQKTGLKTPVFIYFHHPYRNTESASDYDWDRFADMIRPYNVMLLIVGHGHGAYHHIIDGFDEVQGGTTFQSNPNALPGGYMVYSISDGMLRAAYKNGDEPAANMAVLEKPFARRTTYPKFSLRLDRLTASTLRIQASIADIQLHSAIYEIDTNERDKNGMRGELQLQNGQWSAKLNEATLLPGAHYCRVTFTDAQGMKYHQSARFTTKQGNAVARWSTDIGTSTRCKPVLADGTLYVGGNDCALYALNATNGKVRWHVPTGGEVVGAPAIVGNSVIFGSMDGTLYAVDRNGKLRWRYETADPILSTVATGDMVICTTRGGAVHAVTATTGQRRWMAAAAAYTIEAAPLIRDGVIYLGAWDGNVHALSLTDGAPLWKTLSAGAAKSPASRYYSPADSSPVFGGDRLFVADRNYNLSSMTVKTGEIVYSQDRCSAVGASADGQFIYLRKTDGLLAKIDVDGKELWSRNVNLDAMPTPPVEENGIVYVCSKAGLVSALAATDGTVRWQYQTTPQLYVYAPITVQNGVVYVAGSDGYITAIIRKDE